MWIHIVVKFMYIYNFIDTFIWIVFHFLNDDNRPYFQQKVYRYGGISHPYLLQLCIWLIFFIGVHDCWAQSQLSSKVQILFVLLRSNPYISNLYILNQNSRLPYHTICVTHFFYISLLLGCSDCSLTSNMVIL